MDVRENLSENQSTYKENKLKDVQKFKRNTDFKSYGKVCCIVKKRRKVAVFFKFSFIIRVVRLRPAGLVCAGRA